MPIAIVGMLDEREEALRILKERIEERGQRTILIDISMGVGGIRPTLQADIGNENVARAGGGSMASVREMLARERQKATATMAEGLVREVSRLHEEGRLQGMVAVGGMTGTTISLPAFRALPFGVPKLLISSAAAMPAYAGKLSEYFGVRDITVMHAVVDTVGANPLVKALMTNGAGAICGMAESHRPVGRDPKPSIALTEFGFCDKGAEHVRQLLGQKGYNVISFHATGTGDRAAEDLVGQGLFQAFVDMVPAGAAEHVLGGNRDAGPNRLEAAVRQGMPYLLSPCGFDMLSCGPIERREKGDALWASRKLAERKLLIQDAMRVQARTNGEEMKLIAHAVAAKLNQHERKSVVRFLIPVKGFSSVSGEGGALHDPETDRVFVEALKGALHPEIRVQEVEAHINDPAFAAAVVDALEECLREG
jgi:uncharacterized protein (UPF0261 family)